MRVFFLVIGLLLLVGASFEGFQHFGPSPKEILSTVLVVGGFVLLGVAQVLQALAELAAGRVPQASATEHATE